ncbi:MAG: radical SAM protein [ANME-2 cluster archaeon]|nr:radical SAM protein [ANME-2 cluster archaeon]
MKVTTSICPECHDTVEAVIFEEQGKMLIEKTCHVHGTYRDIYWGDIPSYYRFDKYLQNGSGVAGNTNRNNGGCPQDCGICKEHKTSTILANIDITNRCNQQCPICFANANVSGYLYEPTMEQIRDMMAGLKNQKPVMCHAIQFSGGEPTMRNDLFQLIRMGKEMGFKHVQLATNGKKLAESVEYCSNLLESGLKTVYLQFDGITPEPYIATRGFNALPDKLKAIQNCREAGMPIDLVPTVVKGINDHQLGDMIRFVASNIDIIKGLNIQPVSFAGRIDDVQRNRQRITIPDVMKQIEDQTDGMITADDFYPVPFILPLSHLADAMSDINNVQFSVNPHCGSGAYIYVDEKNNLIPVTHFVDVEGLFEHIEELAVEVKAAHHLKTYFRWKGIRKLSKGIKQHVDTSKVPDGIDFAKMFLNLLVDRSGNSTKVFHRKMMLVGIMHFQDLYNIDIERIQRCGVHYALPDGRVIPFCTYNSLYRADVEKQFSKSLNLNTIAV